MKKILLLSASVFMLTSLFAQENPGNPTKKNSPIGGRANDHLLFQIGYTGWSGIPDTINTGGFPKSINGYFMFDFPFKNNPKLSMAFGPGFSSDGIKFEKTYVGIKDPTVAIQFTDQADTTHFKRIKLNTTYFEAPIEFRYNSDPWSSAGGFKFALGVKVGFLMNAHTRNKELQSESGATLNNYVMKEASKRFFNTTRLSAQARLGWGHFTVYGCYQITALFKDGQGPEVHPYSIGLTLSGL